jgi:hypothetical protein
LTPRAARGEDNREALAKASGITKPAVLNKLMELEVRPEALAALAVVPRRPDPKLLFAWTQLVQAPWRSGF